MTSIANKILAVVKLQHLRPPVRKGIAYATGSLLYGGLKSYEDGVAGLEKFRNAKTECKTTNGFKFNNYWINYYEITENTPELTVVRKACFENSFENFWKGITFPFQIVADIIPYIILGLNKSNVNGNNGNNCDDNNDNINSTIMDTNVELNETKLIKLDNTTSSYFSNYNIDIKLDKIKKLIF